VTSPVWETLKEYWLQSQASVAKRCWRRTRRVAVITPAIKVTMVMPTRTIFFLWLGEPEAITIGAGKRGAAGAEMGGGGVEESGIMAVVELLYVMRV